MFPKVPIWISPDLLAELFSSICQLKISKLTNINQLWFHAFVFYGNWYLISGECQLSHICLNLFFDTNSVSAKIKSWKFSTKVAVDCLQDPNGSWMPGGVNYASKTYGKKKGERAKGFGFSQKTNLLFDKLLTAFPPSKRKTTIFFIFNHPS